MKCVFLYTKKVSYAAVAAVVDVVSVLDPVSRPVSMETRCAAPTASAMSCSKMGSLLTNQPVWRAAEEVFRRATCAVPLRRRHGGPLDRQDHEKFSSVLNTFAF